ncbi:Uncharacterized protein SCF082_LOCUS47811, partial [Durusdinium trenchii]
MIDDGFLHALVDDFGKMDKYWEGMAREFPLHPMAANRSRWKSTIGCTLYCDEISCLNDSWLFLMWATDHGRYMTNSMASRWLIAVLPASLYKMNADGTNLTVMSATREIVNSLVNSFNELAHHGVDVRDVASLGGGLVANLKFMVMGFRGDWKAYVQVFGFCRAPNTDEVCWLCEGSKGVHNMATAITDVSENAYWRRTYLNSSPWTSIPPYATLHGFRLEMVVPDLLHMWNLGMARDLAGSVLKIICREQHVFNGPNIEARLRQATDSLKTFARSNGHCLRIKRITRAKLHWETRKYPEFMASGHDSYVALAWLD